MKGQPGGGEKQVGVEDNESSLCFMELDKGAPGTVKGSVKWAVEAGA